MLSLRELQRRVYGAIVTDGAAATLAPWLATGSIPAATRLAVYSNNLHETVRKTLAASFPLVVRLVGDGCFRSLARAYASRYPSRSGDLAGLGAAFPRFLAGFYRGTSYTYLGAVAELEWACVESELAADAAPLDVAALGAIPEAEHARLCFELHPAVRIVSSGFPVMTIWRAHATEEFANVDPFGSAEHVLVHREAGRAVLEGIDAATAAFVAALRRGESLVASERRAAATAVPFDLANTLRRMQRAGLLVGFKVE